MQNLRLREGHVRSWDGVWPPTVGPVFCPQPAVFLLGRGVPRPFLRHHPSPGPFAAELGHSGRKAGLGTSGAAFAPHSPVQVAPLKQSPYGAVFWGLLFEGDKETTRLLIPP